MVEVPAEDGPLQSEPVSLVPINITTSPPSLKLTPTNSAGSVAITARPNTNEIILGGLLGSGRKMWWISGCLP